MSERNLFEVLWLELRASCMLRPVRRLSVLLCLLLPLVPPLRTEALPFCSKKAQQQEAFLIGLCLTIAGLPRIVLQPSPFRG